MRRQATRALALAAALGMFGTAAVPALAQYYGDENGSDPYAFQHPGVPDRNGCVKLCLRDDSPCDPEYFKEADGRCTNTTDNRH